PTPPAAAASLRSDGYRTAHTKRRSPRSPDVRRGRTGRIDLYCTRTKRAPSPWLNLPLRKDNSAGSELFPGSEWKGAMVRRCHASVKTRAAIKRFSADEDPKSARGSTQIQRIHADPAEIHCGSV